MKLSPEELGNEIHRAIPLLIEREIERELKDIQNRIAERVRAAIGEVKSKVVTQQHYGLPEITITVTVGGEPTVSVSS